MYNVARSTNRRAVTRREKYTVETRLGFKLFYTSPINWDLKLRQECSMLNMFIHELLWVCDTEFY